MKQERGVLNIGGDNAVKSFRKKNINDGAPINADYMVLESQIYASSYRLRTVGED